MAVGQKYRIPKKSHREKEKNRPIHLWSTRIFFLTHSHINKRPVTPQTQSRTVMLVCFRGLYSAWRIEKATLDHQMCSAGEGHFSSGKKENRKQPLYSCEENKRKLALTLDHLSEIFCSLHMQLTNKHRTCNKKASSATGLLRVCPKIGFMFRFCVRHANRKHQTLLKTAKEQECPLGMGEKQVLANFILHYV